MKIFLHRNGGTYAYNNDRLKLRDTVTGRTYFLGSIFWSESNGYLEHGRLTVCPTEETARLMISENNNSRSSLGFIMGKPISEFSERFEPVDITIGDWFIFETEDGVQKVGQLSVVIGNVYILVSEGTSYDVPTTDCRFYATAEVPETVVTNITLRTPVPKDIVCLRNDVTKIGTVSQMNWRNKLIVVDYYDNNIMLGEFDANELTVLSKEVNITWGSFSGAIEDAANPRVRDGQTGATHQIYNGTRRSTQLRESSPWFRIPETMLQYCPQLGRSVQTKRYRDGTWFIDITAEDHTTPQGAVEKTWYRAKGDRNYHHEEWLMLAMKRYKEVYDSVLAAIPVVTSVDGVLTEAESAEALELLTATQRIEQAAARFREESAQRAEAARLERIRIDAEAARIAAVHAAERAERQRRQAEEDAKKSIWNYHILKPKVQNP